MYKQVHTHARYMRFIGISFWYSLVPLCSFQVMRLSNRTFKFQCRGNTHSARLQMLYCLLNMLLWSSVYVNTIYLTRAAFNLGLKKIGYFYDRNILPVCSNDALASQDMRQEGKLTLSVEGAASHAFA